MAIYRLYQTVPPVENCSLRNKLLRCILRPFYDRIRRILLSIISFFVQRTAESLLSRQPVHHKRPNNLRSKRSLTQKKKYNRTEKQKREKDRRRREGRKGEKRLWRKKERIVLLVPRSFLLMDVLRNFQGCRVVYITLFCVSHPPTRHRF